MRRIFIAFGILVFILYCWASVAYQNRIDVPGYRLVEVDILGGRTRAAWDADPQAQFQRLMELENKRYQLPEEGGTGGVSPDKALTSDDFAAMLKDLPGEGPAKVALRDASAFHDLIGRHYLLRDSIPDPANPAGQPAYLGGRQIDKQMLDDLRARGVRTITVVGHAAPVNFQLGTALMVALIFFTLAAALKPIVWDPFLAMLEKRGRELESGGEAERQNQQEAVRFEEERRRRFAAVNGEAQALLADGRREAAQAAGAIIREAREQEKRVKVAGLRELGEAADRTEREMELQVPAIAKEMADALTPGFDDIRWDRMERDA